MAKFAVNVAASASFNGNDYPQLFLIIDKVSYGSVLVTTNNSVTYSFGSIDLAPGVPHQVSIAYPNHTSPSQLVTVQSISVGGITIPVSSPVEQYVSGNGTQAGAGQMYYAGQLNFNLDASTFPGTPVPVTPITPVSSPIPVLPAGTEALSVVLSEDAWSGDASAIVLVDGKQVFSGKVTALHGSAGQVMALGNVDASLAHTVAVSFTNDAYGGTQATDRNLYVNAVDVNGTAIAGTAASLFSNGTSTFQIPGPAPTTAKPAVVSLGSGADSLALQLSEDAWQGDAQFTVSIDGVQIGGTQTAMQSQSAGSSAEFDLRGDFSHGAHTVAVTFTNDAYGGTATTDRNLYLNSATLNGANLGKSAALDSNGSFSFSAGTGAAPIVTPPVVAPPVATPPVATPPVATPASAYYVSTTGSDSGNGSAANPFATLQRAATAMAGSTIKSTIVGAGSYNQALSLGSANNGQSFAAAAGLTVTLTGNQANFVMMNGANNVTLSGLGFTGSSGAAVSIVNGSGNTITNSTFSNDSGDVLLGAGSANTTVSNNKMTTTGFAGVEVKDGSNGNIITSNMINGVGPVASNTYGGAIYMHGASSNQITHNQVSNTAGAGINLSDFDITDTATQNLGNTIAYNSVVNADLASSDSGAIYVLGRSGAQTNTVIKMNFIDGTGSASQHSVGIYLDDNTNGVKISGNIVRNIGSDGVQIHGGSNNSITGNVLDTGTGTASAVLFQANPADQPNPSPLQNNSVTGNIITSESSAPGAFFVNLAGGTPVVSGNDYSGLGGAKLDTSPDSAAHYVAPGFANQVAGNYATTNGAGIGFASVDQSQMGLMPTGAHAY